MKDWDWVVKIEYKNKDLETIVEKEYEFSDYADMIHAQTMGLIRDVEDAFYYFSGNKQKKDWDPEMTSRFNAIRHKMLDQGNAIKRLPYTLSYKGLTPSSVNSGEYIAKLIDEIK